ncbi:hypothetical protein P9112_004805 [Eukaryota sp. TZLM1-RC]
MTFTLVELLYTYDVLSSFNQGPIGKDVPRSLFHQALSSSSVPNSALKTCISALFLSPSDITFSDAVILFRAISLLQTSPQSIPTHSQIDSLSHYTPPTFSSISVSTPPSHDIPSTCIYPTPDAVVFAASSFDKLGIQGPASRQSVLPLLQMFRSRVSGDKIKQCWDHFSEGQDISKVSFAGFFCFLGKIAKGEVSGIDEVTEAFNPNPNSRDVVPNYGDVVIRGKSSDENYQKFMVEVTCSDDLRCPICLEVLQDAIEASCCHSLFCQDCVVVDKCPSCRSSFNSFPNHPIRRLVAGLAATCSLCHYNTTRGDFTIHFKKCPKRKRRCNLCSRLFSQCEVWDHLADMHPELVDKFFS